jgi:hypothetical protein
MSDTPICETCRFWYERRDGEGKGECCRYAPRGPVRSGDYNSFPVVWAHRWCGEHEPRPKDGEAEG